MLVYFLTEQSNKICVLLNIYIKYKEWVKSDHLSI